MDLSPETLTRLGKLIRMLSSTNDGEVVSAVRRIESTLKSGGRDIHDLAKAVEDSARSSFRDDPWADVLRKAAERSASADEWATRSWGDDVGARSAAAKRGADAKPGSKLNWHDAAAFCREYGKRLTDSEREFVSDMEYRTSRLGFEPTLRQKDWLRDIYGKCKMRRHAA